MKRFIASIIVFILIPTICLAQNKKENESITSYIEQAAKSYENGDYKKAFQYFEKSLEISSKYSKDTAVYYYAALSAQLAGMYEEAITYYKTALELNYTSEGKTYYYMYDAYKSIGKMDEGLKYLETGSLKYPQNTDILFSLINYYLDKGEDPSNVIILIDKAIDQESNNPSLYFAKGSLYEKLNDYDNARYYYELAIIKNPEFFDAYFNLGALIYNRGVKRIDEANKIPAQETEKYDAVVKTADDEFLKSIQYFEKAYLLNEQDKNILDALKNLYFRFRKVNNTYMNCYNEIIKKINGEQNYYTPIKPYSPLLAAQEINAYYKQESNTKIVNKTIQNQETINETKNTSPIDKNIPLTNQKADNTFALIIGNETYNNEIKVDYAVNDAQIFGEYLNKTLGVPESNIKIITNATVGQIYSQIKWLSDVQKAYKGKASIILYYAGHGMPDETTKDAYILPVDGISEMPLTAIKLDWLYNEITLYPSQRVIVFLDACFSGGSRDGMLAKGRGVKIKPKYNILKNNIVVFSATSDSQTAYPYEEMKHGLFTYYLLEKFNKSLGKTTLGELYEYVNSNVEQKAIVVKKRPQTPTVNTSNDFLDTWKEKTLIE